ncbi:MAG: hypothetical protein A2942_01105 [Candidatus Lloydbacteria bacterium RIFCSPLOWO2_01_FULL_50_20]|uniref:MurNAc-LAA domain-containing protein n=1 Tax=Candidatus Lloydbacteria bacterium RIFCSPLOWO2_01_FULL_50_20 TaxID=1798665 RepID=A0A1G2DIE5_9BACT|nr:MAG: hypothetical protein A2942_01105 [Candidatus Lloydbacteria bacterium RIFCSPLOWO2_01_FULL_50_20]
MKFGGRVTPKLPCPEHEDADENAGFLGRYLAERLDCCSVIACNYRVDVNKRADTDYTEQIAQWKPRLLVEIHGHGGKKAGSDVVEISSGSAVNDKFSQALAGKLEGAFASSADDLKKLAIRGEYDTLKFKASKAVTISDARWTSYHIELPPSLRKPVDAATGKPPETGYQFCDVLADLLKEIHRP